MVRLLSVGLGLFWARLVFAAAPVPTAISMPDFPLPKLALDESGQPAEAGVLRLMRELQAGGLHASDNFETQDNDYVVLSSGSLGLLSAWLEAACKSAGIELPTARQRTYDGTVYANLLEVATGIAASRRFKASLAIPLGVVTCLRANPWGALPGDNQRDAYVILLTDSGFLIYDPPTRQFSRLDAFPNRSSVLKMRF
jgi:hypothetical protein